MCYKMQFVVNESSKNDKWLGAISHDYEAQPQKPAYYKDFTTNSTQKHKMKPYTFPFSAQVRYCCVGTKANPQCRSRIGGDYVRLLPNRDHEQTTFG